MDEAKLRQLWQNFIIHPPEDPEEKRDYLTKLLDTCIWYFTRHEDAAANLSSTGMDGSSNNTSRYCIGNWLIHQFIIDLGSASNRQAQFECEYQFLDDYFTSDIGWKLLKSIYHFNANDALLYNFGLIQLLVPILKQYFNSFFINSDCREKISTFTMDDFAAFSFDSFLSQSKFNEQAYRKTLNGDILSPANVKSWIKHLRNAGNSKVHRKKSQNGTTATTTTSNNNNNTECDSDEETFHPRRGDTQDFSSTQLICSQAKFELVDLPSELSRLHEFYADDKFVQQKPSERDIIYTIVKILFDFIRYEHRFDRQKFSSLLDVNSCKLSILIIAEFAPFMSRLVGSSCSLEEKLGLLRPIKTLLIPSAFIVCQTASGVQLIADSNIMVSLLELLQQIDLQLKEVNININNTAGTKALRLEFVDLLCSAIQVLSETSKYLIYTKQFTLFAGLMKNLFEGSYAQLFRCLISICESEDGLISSGQQFECVYRMVNLLLQLQITLQHSQSLVAHKLICAKRRHKRCDLTPLMVHHLYHTRLFGLEGQASQQQYDCFISATYYMLVDLIFICSERPSENIDKLVCHICSQLSSLIACCWSLKPHFSRLLHFVVNSDRSNAIRSSIFNIIEFNIQNQRKNLSNSTNANERCSFCAYEEICEDAAGFIADSKGSEKSEGYLTDNGNSSACTSSFDSLMSDNEAANDTNEVDNYGDGYQADTEAQLWNTTVTKEQHLEGSGSWRLAIATSRKLPLLEHVNLCTTVVRYLSHSLSKKNKQAVEAEPSTSTSQQKADIDGALAIINTLTRNCRENPQNSRILFEADFTSLLMHSFDEVLLSSNVEDKLVKFAIFDLFIEICKVQLRPIELRLLLDLFKHENADFDFLLTTTQKILFPKHAEMNQPQYSVLYPVPEGSSSSHLVDPSRPKIWLDAIRATMRTSEETSENLQMSFKSLACALPFDATKISNFHCSLVFWIYLDKVNPLIDKYRLTSSSQPRAPAAPPKMPPTVELRAHMCIHITSIAFNSSTIELWFDYIYNRFVYRICKENSGRLIYCNESFICNSPNILGRWNFIRVNIEQVIMSKGSVDNSNFLKISHSTNCTKDETVKLLYPLNLLDKNASNGALLIGSTVANCHFQYRLGNVFLFNQNLQPSSTVFLFSLGSDFGHLHHLRSEAITRENYFTLPKQIARDGSADFISSMHSCISPSFESKLILRHYILIYCAANADVYYAHQATAIKQSMPFSRFYQPSSKKKNKLAQLSEVREHPTVLYGDVRSERTCGISKTIADSGGVAVFLFLLCYVVEHSDNPAVHCKAMELLLRAYESHYQHRFLFDTHYFGHQVLLFVLQKGRKPYSTTMLRVFSQFSIDFFAGHPVILSAAIEVFLSSWRVWTKNRTSLKLFFSNLESLVSATNPYRNYNLAQLRRVNTFSRLLFMIKDMYTNYDTDTTNSTEECFVLDADSLMHVIAIFNAIIDSSSDLSLFKSVFNRILKKHEPSICKHVNKILSNMLPLFNQVSDSATLVSDKIMFVQHREEKEYIEHLRRESMETKRVMRHITSLMGESLHEKASWHMAQHYPQSWALSPFESRNRIRKKLERNFLEIEARHVRQQSTKLLSGKSLFYSYLGASSSLFSNVPASEATTNASTNASAAEANSLLYTTSARVILFDEEIEGEILLNNQYIQFFANQSDCESAAAADCLTFSSKKTFFHNFVINFSEIQEMTNCRYELQNNALEIYLNSGLTYLIAFDSTAIRDEFVKHLTSNREMLPNLVERISLVTLTQLWRDRRISNFEYLTHLNKLSGRTSNDLMQYPVFPFVLADYQSDVLSLKDSTSFRIFSRPIAVQKKERERHYVEQYNYIKSENERNRTDPGDANSFQFVVTAAPYHYGSHYSNSGIVLHYLVRLPPYTQMFLQYQDKNFDIPDRTFHSIYTTWRLATEDSTNGFKELIPEFFYLPEFLLNSEQFNLGVRQNGERVDDVILPPWARNSARLFTLINRQALEANFVTRHLNQWIDLIFGYQQSGKAAVEAINVFHPATHFSSDLSKIEDDVKRGAIKTMIKTFGQMPQQLFNMPHPGVSSEAVLPVEDDMQLVPTSMPEVIGLKWGDYVGSPLYAKPKPAYQRQFPMAIARLWALPTNDVVLLPANSCLMVTYNQQRNIFINTLYIISYSLCTWSSRNSTIWIRNKEDKMLFTQECQFLDKICLCESIPDYDYLLVGYQSGLIVAFSLNPLKNASPSAGTKSQYSLLYGHKSAVRSISINKNYSIALSGDDDGVAILWDMSKLQYIRTIIEPETAFGSVPHTCISDTLGDLAVVSYRYSGEKVVSSKLAVFTINGQPVGQVETAADEPYITSLCYSTCAEGLSINAIATGLSNGAIKLWSSWDLTLLRQIKLHRVNIPIKSISYSFTNDLLYIVLEDNLLVALENTSSPFNSQSTSNEATRKNFRILDLTPDHLESII